MESLGRLKLGLLIATIFMVLVNASLKAQTAQESFGNERFHISLQYGTGSLDLEVDGQRTLEQEPTSGIYEDNAPVNGSYTGGRLFYNRTSLSYLFQRGGRTYFLGLGLENLELGKSGSPLTKSGGTEASFQLNSLITEFGAIRNFSSLSHAKASISVDTVLDGKLRSRYMVRAASTSGAGRYAVIEDHVASGFRLGIQGGYYINMSPGLSTGVTVNAQYGILNFRERQESSAIFGYELGLCFLLKI